MSQTRILHLVSNLSNGYCVKLGPMKSSEFFYLLSVLKNS